MALSVPEPRRAPEACDTAPMSPPRLVLVEDDLALREALTASLGAAGFLVEARADGLDLDELRVRFQPDLALLDIGLGEGPDGFELARRMQAAAVPVLFVTAADRLEERLRGFDLGADDYLVKPFATAELLARVRAVLRRSGRLRAPARRIGDVVIDEERRTVERGGVPVELTKTEFDLFGALARSPGRVFSKAQLLSLVWGFDGYDPNLVEVHVSALRRKLEASGPRLVHTERGEGYVVRP